MLGKYTFLWIKVRIRQTITGSRQIGGVSLTEKDLRKLNRYQLLEMLVFQTERAEKLQSRLEEMESKYNEQDIQLSVLGSIAEASLQLSGIFEAAQKAADLYLDKAKERAQKIEEDARAEAAKIIAEAETCASRIKES